MESQVHFSVGANEGYVHSPLGVQQTSRLSFPRGVLRESRPKDVITSASQHPLVTHGTAGDGAFLARGNGAEISSYRTRNEESGIVPVRLVSGCSHWQNGVVATDHVRRSREGCPGARFAIPVASVAGQHQPLQLDQSHIFGLQKRGSQSSAPRNPLVPTTHRHTLIPPSRLRSL